MYDCRYMMLRKIDRVSRNISGDRVMRRKNNRKISRDFGGSELFCMIPLMVDMIL